MKKNTSSLKKFITNDKTLTTHTKIGDYSAQIFGQKYSINAENEKKFCDIYQRVVLQENQDAYLTEKQLDNGKIAIDLDFRYKKEVRKKQHTKDHLDDFMELLCNGMHEIFKNVEEQPLRLHVFEKQNVNVILQGACSGCPSSTLTLKNGIENMLKEMMPGQVETVNAING